MSTSTNTPRTAALPVFDEHHPPSPDLVADCVHCGFCLQTCPTYRLWGQEAESPRGRIYLMKLGLEGGATLDDNYVQHFDRCLGCMACLTSCPSGVQYDKLIEATRSQIERRHERSDSEKLLRKAIFAIFPHPAILRLFALPLWFYKRTGLQTLIRKSGLLRHLPARLRTIEALAPTVRFASTPRSANLGNRARLSVGMLQGCVQRVFFNDVNAATIRVLNAEEIAVITPRQGCCGALMLHSGEEAQAIELARSTIDAFENVDTVVINAAGCGSAMKDYAHLLRDDPAYSAQAKSFSAKCRDISEVLAGLEPQAKRHPLNLKVAYHDACHLGHAQKITAQPRALLRSIPGLELLEIDDAALCCGSAGIYNLLQPEAAAELGRRKAQNILNTGAQAVVSGNPGCTLQLQSALAALGRPLPVLHWIELLDASMRGEIPAALRNNASR